MIWTAPFKNRLHSLNYKNKENFLIIKKIHMAKDLCRKHSTKCKDSQRKGLYIMKDLIEEYAVSGLALYHDIFKLQDRYSVKKSCKKKERKLCASTCKTHHVSTYTYCWLENHKDFSYTSCV
jgi:hypothetical protein